VQPRTYEVTFVGQAGTTLRAEFDDCEVSVGPATTTLRARLLDQGALQGLMQRITGLGLELIEVRVVAPPADLAAGQCQEHVTMAAAQRESLVIERVRSLEVRWIFPGQLEAAVAGWFGRFPAGTESREDTYLLNPQMRGLSVKVRGGGALEVKAYRGSPGILGVAGRARGRLESWQKWSFPFSPPSQDSWEAADWRPIRKRRRISRFALASGQIVARAPGPGPEPRCAVELTEIRTPGQDWWSLGFEATGPASLLRSALEATAALVFAHALPGVEPGPDDSRSYAEWLCQRPGAESDAHV
jgi:hypothetical protein